MGIFSRSQSASKQRGSPGSVSVESSPPPKPKFTATLEGSNVACVNMEVEVPARADIMFELLADPNQHATIFAAIEGAKCKLLQEDGPKRRYELDYKARWKFWRVTGLCENRLFMETDADEGTVTFKLREPGFLRVYEGTWRITPVGAPALNLHSSRAHSKAPAPIIPATVLTTTSSQGLPQPHHAGFGLVSGVQGVSSMISQAWQALSTSLSPYSIAVDAPAPATHSPLSSSPTSGLLSGLWSTWYLPKPHLPSAAQGSSGLAGMLASINNPLKQLHALPANKLHDGGDEELDTPDSSKFGLARSSLDLSPSPPPPSRSSIAGSSTVPSGMSTPARQSSDPNHADHHHNHHHQLHRLDMPSKALVQVLGMRMSPKVTPPAMLAGLLKGHAITQVEDMLKGLLEAALKAQAELPAPLTSHAIHPSPTLPSIASCSSLASSSQASSHASSGASTDATWSALNDGDNSSAGVYGKPNLKKGWLGLPAGNQIGSSHRISLSEDDV